MSGPVEAMFTAFLAALWAFNGWWLGRRRRASTRRSRGRRRTSPWDGRSPPPSPSQARARNELLRYVHPANEPLLIAGIGTMGMEGAYGAMGDGEVDLARAEEALQLLKTRQISGLRNALKLRDTGRLFSGATDVAVSVDLARSIGLEFGPRVVLMTGAAVSFPRARCIRPA